MGDLVHKTNLTMSLFIEVPVQSQSCVCVLGVLILFLSTILLYLILKLVRQCGTFLFFIFFLYLKFSRKSIFISVHFVPNVDTLECPYLWHAFRRSYSNFNMCIFRLPNMVTWYEGEEQCQHFVGQPLAWNETLIDANKEGSIFNINETGQYTYFCKYFPVLSSFMTYYRACKYSNTTGATSGATSYPSGAP
jgi:hypothetical protein